MAGTSIDARTANRNYPKPATTNGLKFDAPRLIALCDALDVDIAALFAAVLSKANIDSPALTGSPTAPTPVQGSGNTKIATTAYVDTAVAAIDTSDFAPIDSPTFIGAPKVPTAIAGDNSTRIASTAFVQAAISALIDAAPGALDTLNELAAALGDDPNFAATVTNSLAQKLNLTGGTLTGRLILAASTTALTGLRLPDGVDPTSPANGDIWRKESGGGLFRKLSASTAMILDSVNRPTQATAAWQAGTLTTPSTPSPKDIKDAITALTPTSNPFTGNPSSPSRSAGVAYQNASGKTMLVTAIASLSAGGSAAISTSPDNVAAYTTRGSVANSVGTFTLTMYAIVPPGAYYKFAASSATVTITEQV